MPRGEGGGFVVRYRAVTGLLLSYSVGIGIRGVFVLSLCLVLLLFRVLFVFSLGVGGSCRRKRSQ